MNFIKNFILLGFAFIFSLILIELLIRFFLPQALSGSWRVQDKNGLLINKSNSSTIHEFVYNKKKISVKYYFGQFNNRIYKDIDYENTKEKVLVLGDSFTFGWLLNYQDTFIYKLQKKFPDKLFINSSAGGWGTSDYLRYIKSYCENINPSKIIIFINHADYLRSINSKLYAFDGKKLIEGSNDIIKLKIKINKYNEIYNFALKNLHIIQIVRKFFSSYLNETKINSNIIVQEKKIIFNKNQIELIKKLYDEIIIQSEYCGSKIEIVNLSWPNIFVSDEIININNEIELYLNKIDIRYHDLKNEMKKIKNIYKNYSIPFDLHPNEKGSNYIYESILNKNIF